MPSHKERPPAGTEGRKSKAGSRDRHQGTGRQSAQLRGCTCTPTVAVACSGRLVLAEVLHGDGCSVLEVTS